MAAIVPTPPVYHIFHDKEANHLEMDQIINWASHHIDGQGID